MIEDNNIDPKYRDNVYNALKLKVSGFDKSPEEFKEALKSKEYVKNVHNALKLKVSGFDKDLSTFESLVYENTIQKKNQIGNGDSTSKETPSVSSSKIQPVTSLGGEKTPMGKALAISTGLPKVDSFIKKEIVPKKETAEVVKETTSAVTPKSQVKLFDTKKNVLYDKQLKLQRELSTAVVTPENQDEIQQKTDELAKIKSESMKSGKKEPDFVDSLVNNLDVASFSLAKMAVKDAPEFAFDLVTTIGAKAAEVLGDDTLKAMTKYKSDDVAKILGFRNLPAEELQRQIDVANNKIQEYNDSNGGDAITAISNGNYLGASKIIAGSTVQSLPLVLAAMTTGGGALPAIFATSASMEYGELKKNAPEMSDEVKLGSAIGIGIFEGFLGKLFSGASGLAVKRILADKGVEEGSKIVKRGIISSLSNVIGKNPIVGLVGEMGEEGSVEFGKQTIQILNGTRKDYDIKGIGNSAVSSSGIGLTSTTAVYGAKGYMKIADYKKAKNVNQEIDKSINELSNPILTDTDKQTLSNRIDRLSEENRNIVKESLDNIKSLPTSVKNEVYDINNNLEDLKIRTLDIQDNSAMSQETKETLLSEIKREANDLVNRRSKIIDGTYIYDDFNKLSDAEKIDRKDKAGTELLNEAKAKGAEKASFDDAQITKKAVEDYGNERKQRSDREAANQEKPTGDQAVSEYTQPTGEGAEGVRGVQKEVETLRQDEQQELLDAIPSASDALTDGKVDKDKLTTPEDKAKFDEIYDKYDKLITPLLEVTKPAEVKETPDVEVKKDAENKDTEEKINELFNDEDRFQQDYAKNKVDYFETVDTTKKGFEKYNNYLNLTNALKEYFKGGGAIYNGKKSMYLDAERANPISLDEIAELYHKAKADNSNPELVQAVEKGLNSISSIEENAYRNNEYLAKIKQEVSTEVQPTATKGTPDVVSQPIDLTVPKVEIKDKSTDELEKRQAELDEKGFKSFTKESEEFGEIDKELERREWKSVLDSSLEDIPSIVDSLMKKEKEMPNGYGSYMEKKDARETKDVAEKYSKPVTNQESKKDFKDSFFGNPDKWYADGLKMRESVRSFLENGGTFKELLQGVKKEFESDGFSEQEAASVVKSKLDKIKKVNEPIDLGTPKVEVKPTEPTVAEAPIVETPKESKARQTLVDKTKNAEAELKDAWKNLGNLGAIYDPKVQAAKQVAMNKAIVKYVVNKIALGAYDVSTFVKDMASNGVELTKEGADFLFDKSQKAYKTQIEKLTGVSKKPSVGKALEQKRINKAYSIGVAEQKVKTEEAKTKLTEAKSEIKELKDKVKDVFSASIEAVKQVKNRVDKNTKVRAEIGGAIKSLVNKGKLTQRQSADISKKLSELNVENEQDIRDFLDYVDDVFLKSDKYQKIADADKLSARLKSMSKNKTKDNTTRSVTSRLAKIDPSKVKDIDKHTEILKKAIDGLRGSVIKTVNGEKRIEEKRPVNIKEVLEYITEQDEFQYKQAKSEYEDLFGVEAESDLSYEDIKQKISELRSARSLYKRITGKSGSKLTLEKISEMLFEESDKDSEFSEQYKQDAEFILNESKMLAKQIADSGKNPLTGDNLSQRDKNIISSISNFTSKDLSVKQVIDLSNRLNNFYENGVLGGLGDMASKIDGNKSVLDFNKNNRKGIKYRRFFNGDLGVAMGRYLVNPRLIVDEVFRGRQAGEDFWVACGVRGFQNGKAGGIKKASLVLDEFEKFNDNKKNKDFMEIENIYERGMWAHMAREVGVNESEIGENFIKVKDWMKQSYESLLGSKDKDKIKKGESVKIVYDKILKDSNNIEEVKSKVSDVNKQAVKVYQDAFEAEYENTKFTKDAYLNESLRKDNGYAFPVKFGNADIAQKDVTDTALGNTKRVSLRQKATSMNDDTRSSKLGDKYIDLDFDRLAHQEFEKVCIANAVIPHATQYQSFKTNPLFKEIIKDDSTRKLIETTLDNYIIVSQGVNVDKIEYEWNGMNRLMDRANKMAIAQALISVSQPLKQVLPMIPSTIINSGKFDLTVVNNKDFHSFLNESSTSTSIRGFGSLISYDSAAESLKAAEKGNFGKLLQFVDKVNDKELSVLLRGSDSFVAGVSWASYYQQKAGKVSDWKKEKENPNKTALNYADSMVEADQGSSDPDLVGEVFRKKGLQGALIKFMMPLARFSINTKSNIYKNIVISSSKFSSKSDKIEALRGLSGSMVQLAAFKYVSQSVYNIVSDAASYAVGDDEEEKKEFEKILEKEKESNAMLELVGRTLIDAFSVIPATDEIVLELINIASDLINNDTPDALKPEMMNYKNSSYGTGLGLISIPYREISKAIELGQVVYSGLVGSDNVQTLKAQKYASPLLGISIIRALVGMIPSEFGKFAEKSIKQTPTTIKGVKLAIGKGVEEETKVEKTIKRMKKEGKEEAKKEKSKLQKWLDRNKE